MIVNANLSTSRIDSLIRVIGLHHKVIGYTIDDLKGTDPNTKEVVNREILKLLRPALSTLSLIING